MQVRGVGVRYGRRAPWVLRGVDAELHPGDVVEVTGRNGAGKSSLLRVLAGVARPSTGRVGQRPPAVGWAPQVFPTAQPWTVREYLLAQARVRGLPAAAARAAVAREVERLGLEPVLATALPALSGGSAQKVGLAQALLVPPGLLVLDEPWAGLDATARAELPSVVAGVAAAGGTVVVSDHQQQAAALPLTARWHVAGGGVDTAGLPRPLPARATPQGQAVVEVDLPAADAAALVAELAARGLRARVLP